MFVLGLVVGTTAIMGREQPGTAVRLGHVSKGSLPVLRCADGRDLLHRGRGRDAWELCGEGVGNSAARTVGVSGANAGKAHCRELKVSGVTGDRRNLRRSDEVGRKAPWWPIRQQDVSEQAMRETGLTLPPAPDAPTIEAEPEQEATETGTELVVSWAGED